MRKTVKKTVTTRKHKPNKIRRGFTIIEVMVVLAIVGIIMLIVFLAIPALQRNARNLQRKNDAALLAAALQEFITNNGGRLPKPAATGTHPNGTIHCTATHPDCTFQKYVDFTYYGPTSLDYVYISAPALTPFTEGQPFPVGDVDKLGIGNSFYCDPNGDGAIFTLNVQHHKGVVVYALETASGKIEKCLDIGA